MFISVAICPHVGKRRQTHLLPFRPYTPLPIDIPRARKVIRLLFACAFLPLSCTQPIHLCTLLLFHTYNTNANPANPAAAAPAM